MLQSMEMDHRSEEEHTEFCPSDEARLIDGYLRPKIAGKAIVPGYVHDADVCSDHPYDLVRGRAPAPGTNDGVWFFFSPERYVGHGGKSSSSSSRLGHRARAVVGAGGEKKGTWHAEGKKEAVAGTAGGYCRSLTYHQTTPEGSFVKPGWLMVEYGIDADDEHVAGGGGVVLCKVYKSRRGPGSDVPSRKRKTGVEAPSATSSFCQRQRRSQDDTFSQIPWSQAADQLVPTAQDCYQGTGNLVGSEATVPANLWTEQVVHDDDANANACSLLETLMSMEIDEVAHQLPPDFDPEEYLLGERHHAGAAVPPPPCAAQPEECVQMPQQQQGQPTEDDDATEFANALAAMRAFMEDGEDETALQLPANFDPAEYLFGEHQPDAALPPPPPFAAQAAQPEEGCVQTSGGDDDVIEFTLEELMGCSSAPGQCSGTPPAWCSGPWMAPALCAV